MSALVSLRCECCGDETPALELYDAPDDRLVCGGCLDDLLEVEQGDAEHGAPKSDYAPDAWRRW